MLKQPCSAIETNKNLTILRSANLIVICLLESKRQKAIINLHAYAYCLCCSHCNIISVSRNDAKLWKYALNPIRGGQLTIPIISISLTFLHIVRTKVVTDLHMGNNITAHHRFRIAADPRAIHSQIYNINNEDF